VERLATLVPEGPFLFGVEDATDQPLEVMLAELVREQVLKRTFQEVPHSVEVIVEGVEAPREDLHVVTATVWVETDSQKGILVGRAGAMVRAIGTGARKELERELGTRVHLDLAVRVRRSWRTDERALDRLGIE
jgi:GTPase